MPLLLPWIRNRWALCDFHCTDYQCILPYNYFFANVFLCNVFIVSMYLLPGCRVKYNKPVRTSFIQEALSVTTGAVDNFGPWLRGNFQKFHVLLCAAVAPNFRHLLKSKVIHSESPFWISNTWWITWSDFEEVSPTVIQSASSDTNVWPSDTDLWPWTFCSFDPGHFIFKTQPGQFYSFWNTVTFDFWFKLRNWAFL